MEPLNINPSRFRYRVLIGTGGIGTGSFFAVKGDHTLGREESRSGLFLDRRDYCKLHIIAHYVCALMGLNFKVIPIGKVGDDEHGRKLEKEMAEDGLDTRYVRTEPGKSTLYSFCLVYPDGTGGNLTVDDSACSLVDPPSISEAESDFAAFSSEGIALAVPEVPLEARAELLRLGTKHKFLRAASFTSEEIIHARDSKMLANVDLLAINVGEAAVLANMPPEQPAISVVEAALEHLKKINPSMNLSITAGMEGSWVWDREKLTHAPVHRVEAVNAAGAGDAHFAGILTGLASGLTLVEAHELGALTATLSVTSPHTINKDIDRESLKVLGNTLQAPLSEGVLQLLEL